MNFTKTEIDRAKLRMSQSMSLFGRIVLRETFFDKVPTFHEEIYSVFQDKTKLKVLVVAPRGHAKSTISGLVLPLHHIMFDKGKKVIVLVSKTQKHAIRLLGSIMDTFENNMDFRFFFGDWGQTTAKKWTEKEIILKDGTLIVALGTGQQIRGIKQGSTRPTLIIVDDPEDEANTKTVDAMNENFYWLMGAAVPAIHNPLTSRVVVIGTVLHEYCTVKRLEKAKDSGWTVLWYKAIQDDWKTVLWPEHRPLSYLLNEMETARKTGTLSLWYKEFQNEVVAPEEQPFVAEDFRYYDETKSEIQIDKKNNYAQIVIDNDGEKQYIPINIFMGIDPASSIEATADYSAIVVIGMDFHKNIWVLPYMKKRLHPFDLVNEIIFYYEKYNPLVTNVETIQYQEMIRDYFRANKIYIPGIERKNQPRTQKSVRILSLQPLLKTHKVYIPINSYELQEEFLNYVSSRRNNKDDLLDAFYYAKKDAFPPTDEKGYPDLNVMAKNIEKAKKTTYDWRLF